jgi:hypothetical protein
METKKNPAEEKNQQNVKKKENPSKDEDSKEIESSPKKEHSVTEIFAMMDKKSKQFDSLRNEIAGMDSEIEELKKKKSDLQSKIKPVRRVVRKFNPNGIEFIITSPVERKAIRHEVKLIKNQLILKEDELAKKKAAYSGYSVNLSDEMKIAELRNKAQSKNWIKRNRWSVEARVLKALNKLKTEEIDNLRELAKLARSNAKESKMNFDNALQSTLDAVDPETSILCSHELRSVMYEAIRNTLSKWNSRSEFTALL